MLKRKTTIYKQLLFTVLTPMILVIAGLSIYDYIVQTKNITENRAEHINQLKEELSNFIAFFDQTILAFESEMSSTAKAYSDTLVNHIFLDTKNIETINLDSLKSVIGMQKHQDIYIINKEGIIVNTTYPKDLGINFFEFGDQFVTHFNNVWESGEFIEDRISVEMATKIPKKYTYHSTKDKKFIIELGLYNENAKNIVGLFTNKLDLISTKYSDIDTISLYFGTDKFINYQGHEISKDEISSAKSTLKIKKETKTEKWQNGVLYTTLFLYLDMDDSFLHNGYVIRIKYNNSNELALRKAEFKQFGIWMIIIVIPTILIILWRARSIAKPIKMLLDKVDVIRTGNYNTHVRVTGNNEISELGDHFNEMMREIRDSYNTLEDKVEERTKELVQKNRLIEESHREIQDSINYALRLQKAILPQKDEIKNLLPNSFILFKPKDIVSGDFYWFHHKNNTSYVAAADCTGHGVPGALVSVVCSNALNRAVKEFNCTEPSDILEKTREIVIETFARSGKNVKDGMDISLISLEGDTLKYSGANNALWLVRNLENTDAEKLEERSTCKDYHSALVEYKPNKQPIGLYTLNNPFTQHEIKLQKGDNIYLFSDGYADQFGGVRGKKFKYGNFKKLFLKVNELSMIQQKQELNLVFEEWRGDFDQIDDVVVIGIKI